MEEFALQMDKSLFDDVPSSQRRVDSSLRRESDKIRLNRKTIELLNRTMVEHKLLSLILSCLQRMLQTCLDSDVLKILFQIHIVVSWAPVTNFTVEVGDPSMFVFLLQDRAWDLFRFREYRRQTLLTLYRSFVHWNRTRIRSHDNITSLDYDIEIWGVLGDLLETSLMTTTTEKKSVYRDDDKSHVEILWLSVNTRKIDAWDITVTWWWSHTFRRKVDPSTVVVEYLD